MIQPNLEKVISKLNSLEFHYQIVTSERHDLVPFSCSLTESTPVLEITLHCVANLERN